jgi:hypothetical protein
LKSGDELPSELARREERLKRIAEAKKDLEERARAEAEQKQKQKEKDGDNKPAAVQAASGTPMFSPSRRRSMTSPIRNRVS